MAVAYQAENSLENQRETSFGEIKYIDRCAVRDTAERSGVRQTGGCWTDETWRL